MASQETASRETASQEAAIEPVRRLPYCDVILEGLQNNDRDFLHAFGRHLHWGFWQVRMAPLRILRALRTGFATVCSLPLRSLLGMRSWTPAAASAARWRI
jgi:hypothetical protein